MYIYPWGPVKCGLYKQLVFIYRWSLEQVWLYVVWFQVSTLDAVPDIDMLVFLPDILDGLFQILGDPNQEIRKM